MSSILKDSSLKKINKLFLSLAGDQLLDDAKRIGKELVNIIPKKEFCNKNPEIRKNFSKIEKLKDIKTRDSSIIEGALEVINLIKDRKCWSAYIDSLSKESEKKSNIDKSIEFNRMCSDLRAINSNLQRQLMEEKKQLMKEKEKKK